MTLLIGLALNGVVGCANGPDTVQVTVRNDTTMNVVIKQCDIRCNEIHEVHRLNPGQTVLVNTSSGGVDNYWLVVDSNGLTLGCLNLYFTHYVDGAVWPISDMGKCPRGTG